MARSRFGGQSMDIVWDKFLLDTDKVVRVQNSTVTLWSDQTGGTQYTDLVEADGTTAIVGGNIEVDDNGQIPVFYGPDATISMWLDAGSDRVLLVNSDAADVADAATAASAAATAAANSANAAAESEAALADVIATSDGVVAAAIADDTSETRSALTRTGTLPIGQGELSEFNVLDYPVLISTGDVSFANTGDLLSTTYLHGLAVGDPVKFATVTAGAGIAAGVTYYVLTVPTTKTFTLSTARGGSTLALTADGVATGLSRVPIGDLLTNCQPSILAAQTAAAAAGGGVVVFPAAAGYLSTALTLPTDNVWFKGGGSDPVILRRTGSSSAYFINCSGSPTNVGIENMTLDPAGLATTATVRMSTGASKVKLVRCAFTNTGVVGNSSCVDTQTGVSEPTVEDCDFYNTPIAIGDGTVTFTDSGNLVTTPAAHGLAVGNVVHFDTITSTTGIEADEYYFVLTVPTTTTFTLSTGSGGSTLVLTTDGTGTGLAKANGLANIWKLGADIVKPKFRNNNVTGWRDRVFWALSAGTAATVDALVEENHIEGMVPGGTSRQPITFQGVDAALHQRPKILNNTVLGADESYNDSIARGTADLISLHRCVGGSVAGNKAWYGGDVGLTIALQCVGISVYGNDLQYNDTVGMCIGSGISTYSRDHAIGPNICKNNGQGRTVSRSIRVGILFQNATDCTVTGAVLGDDQGSTTIASTVTFTDSGDLVTCPAPHGLTGGAVVQFASITTTTGITADTPYYVKTIGLTDTAFQLTTDGANGTAIALTTNGTGTDMTIAGTQTHGVEVVDSSDIHMGSITYNGNTVDDYLLSGTTSNITKATTEAA